MADVDRVRLETLRSALREHNDLLTSHGRDPAAGATWSDYTAELDSLLAMLAHDAEIQLPVRPWTNAQRLEVDELRRQAGQVDDPSVA